MSRQKPNWKTQADKDPEERRRIASLGGIASGEAKRKDKLLKQLAEHILNAPIQQEKAKEQVKKLFPTIADEDTTNAALVLSDIFVNMMKSRDLKSKIKAAEFLRDTAGQKPETTVNGSVSVEKVFITEKEQKETVKHIEKVLADTTGEK